MTNKTDKLIDEKFLQDFKEYVSLKSISTDPAFKGEIEKTYKWVQKYIEDAGGKTKIFQKGRANPVVYGHFLVDEKLPTVMVYGHYDVQPATKEDGWSTADPFTLEEKEMKGVKRFVGRGVVDNKGQNLIHLFTVTKLFKEKNLKYNVKFMIEGGEECGSPDLDLILKDNLELFQADYVLVSDGEVVKDFPVIDAQLRGVSNMKIELRTAHTNHHSGLFGGAIPSASAELVKILNSLKDKNNKVSIKDFYKNVPIPNKRVLANNKNLGSKKDVLKMAGVKKLRTIKNYDFYTQVGCMPSLEITGMKSGYIGEGYANIVTSTAEARINIRTVPNQKTPEVVKLVVNHIKKLVPKYVEVKIEQEGHGNAILLDDQSEVAKAIKPILEKAYGKKVVKKYVGGSIPILADFQKILKSKVISVSLGNDDCHMHGLDENFRVDLIEKGLKFADMFWKK
jgi:acetylornithine deacetylase/succinyl-diaminopimelate desuccinylase-like protein